MYTRNEGTMKTSKPRQLPLPLRNNICDGCGKDMGERSSRYCLDCMKAIAERAAPKDCKFCDGKKTVHATYHFESDYGKPYICHKCMKDQGDGYVWPHIPPNIAGLPVDATEEMRIVNW